MDPLTALVACEVLLADLVASSPSPAYTRSFISIALQCVRSAIVHLERSRVGLDT